MPMVLSNDDGVHAAGLATLHEVLIERSDCLIVAPTGPQSGVGHAVTTKLPMVLTELAPGRFGLDGTPADCARVALGIHRILSWRRKERQEGRFSAR